ncbi:prepilin-type N-terminal cleavage/methylation domain-containing protein [Aquabacterium sp. A7-Y]|uniref:prepilin-type N-terminal cleavage/methylation domain-containing protein n=1 Tax=Aquabacterium sp. A7-Y TaxID=1349605 RepID=UPI00223E651B|nr:prepilin-type N-terminal cleavage/methylation domain-containing protein [Aquabacterium sp. A7-Y]MCW7539882.1 prepilin-type N-terminal cleavage/methylation domain-containing protein [Aquabacterium sp. A7-Y]
MAPRERARGFTLLELLVVLALFAMVVSTVSLAIRDPSATQLEREAERLSALLESARAQARAQGLAVRWQTAKIQDNSAGQDFQFVGLPDAEALPTRWLNPEVRAEVIGAPFLQLGPDPIIGAQRLTLLLGDRRVTLATDGLQPFTIVAEPVQ